jgi:hypothetical protein
MRISVYPSCHFPSQEQAEIAVALAKVKAAYAVLNFEIIMSYLHFTRTPPPSPYR